MIDATTQKPIAARRLTSWLMPLWLIGALCLVTTAGCRGCLREDTEKLSREEIEKRVKEQKEAIVASQLSSLPADTEIKTMNAKPGHWIETVRKIKSNREDLQVIATGDVLRGPDKVLNIPGTNVTAEFARATVLPKGQTKTVDLQYFVPTTSVSVDQFNPVSTALRLRSSLLSKSLLTPILQEPFPTNELRYAEFLITVVSPRPQEYSFLSATDLVLWRGSDLMIEERTRSYHVILCGSEEGKLPFPTSMLTMTAMAVVVWDDLAPDDLSEDQKTALLDWLHWGGQLVISGPGSWSRLQNSFLSPYLPIKAGEAIELGTEELKPLNHWVVPDMTGQLPEPLQIVGSKVPGLGMQLSDSGNWLPETGELVAERAVGRGRVVVSSFPLREQRIYRWKYFPSFFSTGLLRRPGRTVKRSEQESALVQVWDKPFTGEERNPLLNTQVRIASRDMPLASTSSEEASAFEANAQAERQQRMNVRNLQEAAESPILAKFQQYSSTDIEAVQWSPNGAAWSDTSGFAFRALSALRDAAGIVLPDRLTIIYLIGGYLAILVPLNWLVFRLIGRLEFAWLAAPVIALIGVVVVTRVAELDIGFARRTTEIGLLELQGEYPRGHITNYTALYTSLTTNYALEYPERGSVALPLGDISRRSRRAGGSVQTMQAKYGTSPGIRLEPVTVYSNSTEMLHSEQMIALPGGLLYGTQENAPSEAAIKNTTGLKLRSSCLVRKTAAGEFQFAWLGDLVDDNTRHATFVSSTMDAPWEYWNRSSVTKHPDDKGPANGPPEDETANSGGDGAKAEGVDASALVVGGLLSELLHAVPLVPGQVRLLAYTDDRPGKMVSEPADGRLDSRSVVMAHLRPGNWRALTPDRQVIGRLPNAAEPLERDVDLLPTSE